MITIGDCYDTLMDFGEMLQLVTDMHEAARLQDRLLKAVPKGSGTKPLMMALVSMLTAAMEKHVPNIHDGYDASHIA